MSSDFTSGRVVTSRRLGILPINAEPAHSALLDGIYKGDGEPPDWDTISGKR